MYSERLANAHFWLSFIGTAVVFTAMHIVGLYGMPRRIWDYVPDPTIIILNQIASVGAYLIGVGMIIFLIVLIRDSIKGKPADMKDPFAIGEIYYDYRRREQHH
jgi:cytochrome c oxidase subunit 1